MFQELTGHRSLFCAGLWQRPRSRNNHGRCARRRTRITSSTPNHTIAFKVENHSMWPAVSNTKVSRFLRWKVVVPIEWPVNGWENWGRVFQCQARGRKIKKLLCKAPTPPRHFLSPVTRERYACPCWYRCWKQNGARCWTRPYQRWAVWDVKRIEQTFTGSQRFFSVSGSIQVDNFMAYDCFEFKRDPNKYADNVWSEYKLL